jgi:hypothetical protein
VAVAVLLALLTQAPSHARAGSAGTATPVPNTIFPVAAPTPADATPVAAVPSAGVHILDYGFGQSKAGAPVTVAARLRNDGPPADLVPVSVTVFDANGTVIGAADFTTHFIDAGETSGVAHRLTVHGTGAAAQVQLQVGSGHPAGDPLPGALSFGDIALVSGRTGLDASSVLTSSYANDLSEVRVDAIADDATGAIIGGGEEIKRVVPAGGSVGVLVPLDVSGTPAAIELYAHLP